MKKKFFFWQLWTDTKKIAKKESAGSEFAISAFYRRHDVIKPQKVQSKLLLHTYNVFKYDFNFNPSIYIKYRSKKNVVPIIWDDMLRTIPAHVLVDSELGQIVEPMVMTF